jgi:3-hydroxyacyl-[acyl-carrier-protein] dehydratase
MTRLTLHIAADHPAGAGHFPGNPIVPGALLLADVVRCIEQAEHGKYSGCSVRNAKFPSPARPGDTVDIEYAFSARGAIEFSCTVSGTTVLSGGFVASE